MTTPTPLIPVGTHVHFTADRRISGTVVGYATVDNREDDFANDNNTYVVAIVRLDKSEQMPNILGTIFTHVPIDPSLLAPHAS